MTVTRPKVQFFLYTELSCVLIMVVVDLVATWLMNAMGVIIWVEVAICVALGLAVQRTWRREVIRPLQQKLREQQARSPLKGRV